MSFRFLTVWAVVGRTRTHIHVKHGIQHSGWISVNVRLMLMTERDNLDIVWDGYNWSHTVPVSLMLNVDELSSYDNHESIGKLDLERMTKKDTEFWEKSQNSEIKVRILTLKSELWNSENKVKIMTLFSELWLFSFFFQNSENKLCLMCG